MLNLIAQNLVSTYLPTFSILNLRYGILIEQLSDYYIQYCFSELLELFLSAVSQIISKRSETKTNFQIFLRQLLISYKV